ncbi:MAG: hypothetical protein GXY05_01080 [Clostridiales bacterium]|nr:hypothetical protein [Clostridiales bacterium]
MTGQLAVGEAVALPGDVPGEVAGEVPGDAVVTTGGGLGERVVLGVGVGLGVGVVPVGVQPAKNIAARMTVRVSAMSFFIIIVLLT